MPDNRRPLKVFLCHAHSDAAAVRGIYLRLKRDGVDAWLDKEKLLPGEDWEREIRKAVRASDVVVVCLSKQFNQEGFRQKEVRLALDTAMEKPEGEIFIIPARLEECESLESLSRWHWVDLFEDEGYHRLLRALRARAERIGATVGRSKRGRSASFPSIENAVEKPVEPPPVSADPDLPVRSRPDAIRAANVRQGPKEEVEKPRTVIEERVLEAAIERQVRVGTPASVFVWVRRVGSKSIISVVSTVDEDILLDEENVKAKGMSIEFPVKNGRAVPVQLTLRLVAHEFNPATQEKKILVPPDGDSEVCTFIVTPNRAGTLLLSLEVVRDEINLANRSIRTTAVETDSAISSALTGLTMPVIVFVQGTGSSIAYVPKTLQSAEKVIIHGLKGEKADFEAAEKLAREKARLEAEAAEKLRLEAEQKAVQWQAERARRDAELGTLPQRLVKEKRESEAVKRSEFVSPKKGASLFTWAGLGLLCILAIYGLSSQASMLIAAATKTPQPSKSPTSFSSGTPTVSRTSVVEVTPSTSVPVGSRPSTYTLRPEEFPYCIARRFDVDPQELLELNGLANGFDMSVRTLKIPQTGSFPGNRAQRHHPAVYTVTSSNETIHGVACHFGDVDPLDLAKANGLSVYSPLEVGQQLDIP